MKRSSSIQLKAAFLLIVFGLNIAVGFACAVGLDDMMLGKGHHGHDEAIEIHVHKDGTKHEHHGNKTKHNHDEKDPSNKEKGGCCSDKVVKLALVDKSVPQSDNLVHPLFFTAFISTFYSFGILYHSQVIPSTRYFVRGHHPPINDIRIAIQSFQI